MASDIYMKQHDSWPPLTATLTAAGAALDLTAATQVKLILKSTAYTITGICTITDAVNGVVKYTWASGDLANAGVYNGEFEVTYSGGRVETVPNNTYFTLEVVADLG